MGVTIVVPWKLAEGRSLQQTIEDFNTTLEGLNFKKAGLFSVDCESFYSVLNQGQGKHLHMVSNSEYPASRFAQFDEGSSSVVTDVMLFPFLTKLRSHWQQKKGGKIESKGHRYEYLDFIVKIGIVGIGGSTRGVSVEIEYTPCVFAKDCWNILQEIMQMILGDQTPSVLPLSMSARPNDVFTPEHTVQQYIEMFNNIRRTNMS